MQQKNFKLNCLAFVASVMFIFAMSSCASKSHFLISKVVHAAQGTVDVKTDKNKNYVIKIMISNLSPSTRLTPPSNAYVVWMVTNDNSAKNMGQLNSSTNFMSNDLSAKFVTISGTKPEKIIITAENDPSVQTPSFSEIILTTDYLNIRE